MNITKFSINRPVGISMIVAFFVVLGLFSYYRIGVELLPNINIPYITVHVRYPGASAESVEQQIVKPVEDALASISNVKKMTSSAEYERGKVTLELEFGADADAAAIDATKKIEQVRGSLPDEAESPTVFKRDTSDMPIMEIAVTSPEPLSAVYSRANKIFTDTLQQAGGVSEIEIRGGRDKEIAIEVDKDKMSAYKLTLDNIVSAIKSENKLLPSGSVYTEKGKSDVKVIAQYREAAEIKNIIVKNSEGNNIPITAVAEIREQDARMDRFGRLNGEDSVNLEVYKNSNANVVETADNVLNKLEVLKKNNPDCTFTVVNNSAEYVSTSLHNTLGTLIEGLCTTGLVLYLFLRGWRSTAAVMIAIPTSLISTFFVMYIAGFTFNMMSLMGMTLCIGILVDDAIVVLENIIRHLNMGEEPAEAAEKGRMEIGMAAIAITLCDAVTFMPIAFMTGMTGQFFKQFGLTIVFAGLFSLLVSFTLTPMMASKFFPKNWQPEQKPLWHKMDIIERWTMLKYGIMLKWVMANQKKMLAGIGAVFIAVMSLIPLNAVGSEYMPQTDEGSFQIMVQLPVDKNTDETNKVMVRIEEKLRTIPEVKYFLTRGGGSSAYEGRIMVTLVDKKERSRSVWDITKEMRKFAGEIHEADVRVSETQTSVAGVSNMGPRGGGGALQLELRGDDYPKLIAASEKVQKILKGIDGVRDVNSSYVEGMPELQLKPDREKLKAIGASIGDINTAFYSAVSGRKAGNLINDPLNEDQDTSINVRFKNADGFKASDIASIPVSVSGKTMFLGDLAEMSYGKGPVTIRRVDKQRSIDVGGSLGGRPLNDVLLDAKKELEKADLGDGITYKFKGQADRMNDAFGEMLMALILAMVLIYMLLAVLYESVITPFIRMFSLPLGLIGSVLFLFITNNTLNLYSMIGILVMDGIVAKNGTLLLDYTLTLMERGMSAYDAVIEAGKVRLKPIFMTTLTMIVGMLPMALAMTEGSETRVSMAWVIIGGLLTSTIFTLLVIPVIFLFFENHPVSSWFTGLRKRFA